MRLPHKQQIISAYQSQAAVRTACRTPPPSLIRFNKRTRPLKIFTMRPLARFADYATMIWDGILLTFKPF